MTDQEEALYNEMTLLHAQSERYERALREIAGMRHRSDGPAWRIAYAALSIEEPSDDLPD